MARLWIFSDLHFEIVPYPEPFQPQRPDFDVMVVAGDIRDGDCLLTFQFLRRLGGSKPIIFVMGNHDYWNGVLGEELAMAKQLAKEYGITLLDGEAAAIAGCQFVGATLWTDYALAPAGIDQQAETGEQIDIDHDGGTHLITVGDAIRLHRNDRKKIESLIADVNGGLPLIVVTHHAPHPACLPETHREIRPKGSSVSDLSHLTDGGVVALWVHGHIHASTDIKRPNGTRIVCNPAGPMFCNVAFNAALVVEV